MGQTHHDGITVNNLVVATRATVPAPSANTDAATKLYVDTIGAGGSLTNPNVSAALIASTTLTAAQIKALLATPITLIAAPSAGKAIQVLGVVASYTKLTTDFTNAGGNVSIVQGSQALVSAASLTALFVNVGSLAKSLIPTDNATLTANTAVTISKATNEFAAGLGSIVIAVTYVVVTL